MNNIKLRERYQGRLIRLACGDAVGAPLPDYERLKMPEQLKSKGSTYQSTRRLQSSEIPWVMCKIPSQPSVMKRLVTSVLTCLRLLISLPFLLPLVVIKILMLCGHSLLTWLGITKKLDRLYLDRVKRSWYK